LIEEAISGCNTIIRFSNAHASASFVNVTSAALPSEFCALGKNHQVEAPKSTAPAPQSKYSRSMPP
jgi:hypothetical protein